MISQTTRISYYDLSDRKHPERGGRYVFLPDLLIALKKAEAMPRPIDALEDMLLQVMGER